MTLPKFQLAIFDHSPPPLGYHFRSDVNHEAWEQAILKENDEVRILSEEEIDNRWKVVPLSASCIAILASTKITSDGRPAVRTASILYESDGGPIRWAEGLCELVRKSLNSSAKGGEMTFDLSSGTWPLSLGGTPLRRTKRGVFAFEGGGHDHVMNVWSMLPPDERKMTEVILGASKESESLPEHIESRWVHKPSGLPPNLSVLGNSEYTTPANADELNELNRAAVVADSTGFSGEEWMEVLASEMDRKGVLISEVDLFSIRLKLAKNDLVAERRNLWRKMVVQMVQESLLDRYEEFLEMLPPLDADEISHFHSSQQTIAVELFCHHFSSTGVGFSSMIAHLSTYLRVLRFESWEHFLSIVRLDRLYKAKKSDVLDDFLVNLWKAHPNLLLHHAKSLNHPTVLPSTIRQHFIQFLERTSTVLQSQDAWFDVFLDMRIPTRNGSSKGDVLPLHRQFGVLFPLNWTNLETVAQKVATIHAAGSVDALGNRIRDFEAACQHQGLSEFLNTRRTTKIDHAFGCYLRAIEGYFRKKGSLPSEALAYQVAPLMSSKSWWFNQTISQFFDGKKARELMRGADLDLGDLPASLLQKLHSTSPPPRLFGWPSPLRSVPDDRRFFMSARLSIQPKIVDRIHRLAGALFGLVGFSFILLLLTMQIFDTLLVDVEVPSALVDWNDERELRIGACCTSALSLFLLYRYRTNIKFLRNNGK